MLPVMKVSRRLPCARYGDRFRLGLYGTLLARAAGAPVPGTSGATWMYK